MNNSIDIILNGLVRRYKERVPDVTRIIRAMIEEGVINHEKEIENDHIAFRTIGVPHLGVQSLEKIFLFHGYRKMDYYFFPEKKLNAWWYAPPAAHLPRIFISELRVEDLSAEAKKIVHSYTDRVKTDPVDALDLNDPYAVDRFLHSSLWPLPRLEDYELLSKESEYAAWVIYNRYYLNHFTIAVHNLKEGYNTVADFNRFLEQNGIVLNDSGGKIKTSPDGGLLQSSTVAQTVKATFFKGEEEWIPGSYVEFAERKIVEGTGQRREGFEAANADRIFESTYREQVEKR